MNDQAPTPQGAWEIVWEPILGPEDDLDLDKLKSLLFDYGSMLHDLSIFFHYITEGAISHPQTPVGEVMQTSDLVVANTIDDSIRQVLSDLLDTLESVNTEPEDIQLQALISRITELYEAGADD